MTYQELYEELRKLTPEQRQQEARICGIDRPGMKIGEIWIVEEDQVNPSGDGMEPVSVYKDDPDFNINDEPIVCKAGVILLLEAD